MCVYGRGGIGGVDEWMDGSFGWMDGLFVCMYVCMYEWMDGCLCVGTYGFNVSYGFLLATMGFHWQLWVFIDSCVVSLTFMGFQWILQVIVIMEI